MEITIRYPCFTRDDRHHNAIVTLSPKTGASIKTLINPCSRHIEWLHNLSPCEQYIQNRENLIPLLINNVRDGVVTPQGDSVKQQIQWLNLFFACLFQTPRNCDPIDSIQPEDLLPWLYDFFLEQSEAAANRFVQWIWETYPWWKDSYWAASVIEWNLPIRATPSTYRHLIQTIIHYHQLHKIPFSCYTTKEILSSLTSQIPIQTIQSDLRQLGKLFVHEIQQLGYHDHRSVQLALLLQRWNLPEYTDIINQALEEATHDANENL